MGEAEWRVWDLLRAIVQNDVEYEMTVDETDPAVVRVEIKIPSRETVIRMELE